MPQEQLQAFLEHLRANPALQQALREATAVDAVVRLAADAGFTIAPDDLRPLAPMELSELSEAELEEVAGGMAFNLDTFFCGNFP